jgi:hypothetical protein
LLEGNESGNLSRIGASWWILGRVSESGIGNEILSGKRILLMTLTENERAKAIEKRRKRRSNGVSWELVIVHGMDDPLSPCLWRCLWIALMMPLLCLLLPLLPVALP